MQKGEMQIVTYMAGASGPRDFHQFFFHVYHTLRRFSFTYLCTAVCSVIFFCNSGQVFDGNLDTDSIVYNKLKQPITARYIRIQPVAWRAGISMRMELYGCPGICNGFLDRYYFKVLKINH